MHSILASTLRGDNLRSWIVSTRTNALANYTERKYYTSINRNILFNAAEAIRATTIETDNIES